MSVKTKTTKIRVENIQINSPWSIWNDWKMHLFRNGLRFHLNFFAPRINSRTNLALYTYYRCTVEHKSIPEFPVKSKGLKYDTCPRSSLLGSFCPKNIANNTIIQMMTRKERMVRRPRRRCPPAETTSCTSWPCPGNCSLPWSLPPVSRKPSLKTIKISKEKTICSISIIITITIIIINPYTIHLLNSQSRTWELYLTLNFLAIMKGYPTFVISILAIGGNTALIGDIAGHLGCFIYLKDSVNAIAFVALGTSVPGRTRARGMR